MADSAMGKPIDVVHRTGSPLQLGEMGFRRLLEGLPAGAYTCDASGLITYFNPNAARLWGRKPALNDPADRFCGSLRLFATDGCPIPHSECWMALALKHGRDYSGHEIVVERPTGDRVVALAHANPIRNDAGQLLGAVSVLVDITGQKRSEEALRESHDGQRRLAEQAEAARKEVELANRAKADFLATMSHELRTPLNAISGFTSLLMLELRGPLTAEQREDLARIKRSQEHLLTLINDILNFAKLDAGTVPLSITDVPLRLVIADLAHLVEPQVRAKTVHLECDAECDELVARADIDRVSQIVLHVLTNAVKFTKPGGAIRIRCDADHALVHIHISDTGIGIPAEKMQSVFEPFVQVERHLSSPRDGIGLGLAISRTLARAMNGDMRVESAVGEGSTFTLSLPRAR